MDYDTFTSDVGLFVFLDATYAELDVGYFAQIGGVKNSLVTTTSPGPSTSVTYTPDPYYENHIIVVELLGKYPFAVTKKLSVFPLLGAGVKFAVGGNSNSDYAHDVDWGVNIQAGGGLDYSLTEKLYLRGEAIVYYQVASDRKANIPEMAANSMPTQYDFASKGYYVGPRVKLAAGYKFF
jgi:hypothetical protein